MVLCFARSLVAPCHEGRDGPMYLFQRPILRLIVQGQSFVALFFILMGFVNSLKPLKQAQSHQQEDALMALAKSSLNRTARLVLPATAVTAIAWAACQLRLFEVARKSDAYWLQVNSKPPSESMGEALMDLFQKGILQTWTKADNPYDQPQWALRYLLLGSMNIFLVLLITITMQAKFRIFVLTLLYIYCWVAGDCTTTFSPIKTLDSDTNSWVDSSRKHKRLLWRHTRPTTHAQHPQTSENSFTALPAPPFRHARPLSHVLPFGVRTRRRLVQIPRHPRSKNNARH